VELILNKKAEKLDIKKKQVILSDKKIIPFDKLLIATGGIPFIPEIENKDLYGVFTFTKWKDAEELSRYIEKNRIKEAVVLGGGLIGLKATEALMELKIRVTIIELAERILSATFDKKASDIIEKALEKEDCQVITNNTINRIKNEKLKIKSVVLKDKKEIDCDLLILAIGVNPNIELVKDTPIKVDKGILVNEFMQTNVEGIYASGDCCEIKDLLLNKNRPIAIWPNASRQGKISGYNMTGIKKEYEGSFAMNSVELCGIPTISVGITSLKEEGFEIIDYFDEKKLIYKKVVLKDNKILGAIFINDIERAGIYTGLIKDRVNVKSFKEHLLKEDFGLISLPKEYRKHLVSGLGIEV
ncbi:MAG: FAD-dependent oxidoreductase, partial [Candidatus Omnitrophica bacterium]|nr:FAD-dependent oxidoreductase [Candidatus Omnitrophota bacterium]